MTPREYKKYLAYKEVERIARGIRRGFKEVEEMRAGKRKLQSAYDLVNELAEN